MRLKSFVSIVAFVSLLSAGTAPAVAADPAEVQEAIAELTMALNDLRDAEAFYTDVAQPSVLSSLASFTDTLVDLASGANANSNLRKVLRSDPVQSLTRDKTFIDELRRNVSIRAGVGIRSVNKDQFYREFIGTLLITEATREKGEAVIRHLFGKNLGQNLIERYDLAVSRTRI